MRRGRPGGGRRTSAAGRPGRPAMIVTPAGGRVKTRPRRPDGRVFVARAPDLDADTGFPPSPVAGRKANPVPRFLDFPRLHAFGLWNEFLKGGCGPLPPGRAPSRTRSDRGRGLHASRRERRADAESSDDVDEVCVDQAAVSRVASPAAVAIVVADRSSLEINFRDGHEVVGAGRRQVRFVRANSGRPASAWGRSRGPKHEPRTGRRSSSRTAPTRPGDMPSEPRGQGAGVAAWMGVRGGSSGCRLGIGGNPGRGRTAARPGRIVPGRSRKGRSLPFVQQSRRIAGLIVERRRAVG